jgi:hypothetical protein
LVSTASSISFNNPTRGAFDSVSRLGGGRQLIIAARSAPPAFS